MNDVWAIARENAFSFEAKKTGFGQAQDGWSITLRVQHDDLPSEVKNARKGTRYMVALVEIGDDEQPIVHEQTREDATQASTNAATITDKAAPDSELSRVPARRNFTLPQKAYLLCEKPSFQVFLLETYGLPLRDSPATWLRSFCGVNTRANILPGTPAAERFYQIDSEFTAWERVAA